jgi:hypothetical protein
MIQEKRSACSSLVKKEKKIKLYQWLWFALLLKAGVDIFAFWRNRGDKKTCAKNKLMGTHDLKVSPGAMSCH